MMQHIYKKALTLFSLLFIFAGSACAASYEEGTHYKRIDKEKATDTNKVEVVEFFMYSCPHCYAFEPSVNKWKQNKPDNVEFIRMPVTFNSYATLHARAYYALQLLDKTEEIHPRFFTEIHVKKNYMKTLDSVAGFVQQHGVNRSEFIDAMNSFSVESNIRKTTKLVKDYRLSGVPAVTINGKYLISASMAGNYENMIKIMNYLIEKESAEASVNNSEARENRS
jgi:thiol:disulfide interchange protein DsbA